MSWPRESSLFGCLLLCCSDCCLIWLCLLHARFFKPRYRLASFCRKFRVSENVCKKTYASYMFTLCKFLVQSTAEFHNGNLSEIEYVLFLPVSGAIFCTRKMAPETPFTQASFLSQETCARNLLVWMRLYAHFNDTICHILSTPRFSYKQQNLPGLKSEPVPCRSGLHHYTIRSQSILFFLFI